jgi:hypothetical protein
MRLSLAYEMQRPVVDDHAVIESLRMSSMETFGRHAIPEPKRRAA